MKLLNRLERKFGRYAIRNLMSIIIGGNAAVFFVTLASPQTSIVGKIALIPQLVLRGEVWRLITFIFIPPTFSLLWALFVFYFYYLVGTSLESEWGSFKFNVYYLVGIVGTALSAFISGQGVTAFYLNLSLFLAFAYIFPNFEVLLFFIIPVKVKYLAWLNAAFLGFTFLTGPLSVKLSVAAALLNFVLFFGKDIIQTVRLRGGSLHRMRKFHAKMPQKDTYHRCTVCGMTERDDEDMEFRFCSKCEGSYEYCMPHLKDHEHIVKKEKENSG